MIFKFFILYRSELIDETNIPESLQRMFPSEAATYNELRSKECLIENFINAKLADAKEHISQPQQSVLWFF